MPHSLVDVQLLRPESTIVEANQIRPIVFFGAIAIGNWCFAVRVNLLDLCMLFQGIITPLAKSCCFLQTLPGGLCFIIVSLSDANKFYLYSMSVSLQPQKQMVLLVKNLSSAKKKGSLYHRKLCSNHLPAWCKLVVDSC